MTKRFPKHLFAVTKEDVKIRPFATLPILEEVGEIEVIYAKVSSQPVGESSHPMVANESGSPVVEGEPPFVPVGDVGGSVKSINAMAVVEHDVPIPIPS
ncbi:hypothetical protein Nepgr_023210 [Nepenthes gracilis]|uniref:Uncharacterized protein n=1 Tax=Nepenthes gracilis TaxID=150966 RepID=A0AAD3T1N1_NEPGR|nr:hypothetical protein Nepgr_023210 [Nepenthes gracilis]